MTIEPTAILYGANKQVEAAHGVVNGRKVDLCPTCFEQHGTCSCSTTTNQVTFNKTQDVLISDGFDGIEEIRCPAMDRKRAENAKLLKEIDDVLLPASYDGGTDADTNEQQSSSSRGEPVRNVRKCFQARTPDPDACETAVLEKRYKSQTNNKTFDKHEDVLLPLEMTWDE